jgi:hypothetical protein
MSASLDKSNKSDILGDLIQTITAIQKNEKQPDTEPPDTETTDTENPKSSMFGKLFGKKKPQDGTNEPVKKPGMFGKLFGKKTQLEKNLANICKAIDNINPTITKDPLSKSGLIFKKQGEENIMNQFKSLFFETKEDAKNLLKHLVKDTEGDTCKLLSASEYKFNSQFKLEYLDLKYEITNKKNEFLGGNNYLTRKQKLKGEEIKEKEASSTKTKVDIRTDSNDNLVKLLRATDDQFLKNPKKNNLQSFFEENYLYLFSNISSILYNININIEYRDLKKKTNVQSYQDTKITPLRDVADNERDVKTQEDLGDDSQEIEKTRALIIEEQTKVKKCNEDIIDRNITLKQLEQEVTSAKEKIKKVKNKGNKLDTETEDYLRYLQEKVDKIVSTDNESTLKTKSDKEKLSLDKIKKKLKNMGIDIDAYGIDNITTLLGYKQKILTINNDIITKKQKILDAKSTDLTNSDIDNALKDADTITSEANTIPILYPFVTNANEDNMKTFIDLVNDVITNDSITPDEIKDVVANPVKLPDIDVGNAQIVAHLVEIENLINKIIEALNAAAPNNLSKQDILYATNNLVTVTTLANGAPPYNTYDPNQQQFMEDISSIVGKLTTVGISTGIIDAIVEHIPDIKDKLSGLDIDKKIDLLNQINNINNTYNILLTSGVNQSDMYIIIDNVSSILSKMEILLEFANQQKLINPFQDKIDHLAGAVFHGSGIPPNLTNPKTKKIVEQLVKQYNTFNEIYQKTSKTLANITLNLKISPTQTEEIHKLDIMLDKAKKVKTDVKTLIDNATTNATNYEAAITLEKTQTETVLKLETLLKESIVQFELLQEEKLKILNKIKNFKQNYITFSKTSGETAVNRNIKEQHDLLRQKNDEITEAKNKIDTYKSDFDKEVEKEKELKVKSTEAKDIAIQEETKLSNYNIKTSSEELSNPEINLQKEKEQDKINTAIQKKIDDIGDAAKKEQLTKILETFKAYHNYKIAENKLQLEKSIGEKKNKLKLQIEELIKSKNLVTTNKTTKEIEIATAEKELGDTKTPITSLKIKRETLNIENKKLQDATQTLTDTTQTLTDAKAKQKEADAKVADATQAEKDATDKVAELNRELANIQSVTSYQTAIKNISVTRPKLQTATDLLGSNSRELLKNENIIKQLKSENEEMVKSTLSVLKSSQIQSNNRTIGNITSQNSNYSNNINTAKQNIEKYNKIISDNEKDSYVIQAKDLQDKINQATRDETEAKQKLNEENTAKAEIDTEVTRAKQAETEATQKLNDANQAKDKAQKQVADVKDSKTKAQTKLQDLKAELKNIEAKIKDIDDTIALKQKEIDNSTSMSNLEKNLKQTKQVLLTKVNDIIDILKRNNNSITIKSNNDVKLKEVAKLYNNYQEQINAITDTFSGKVKKTTLDAVSAATNLASTTGAAVGSLASTTGSAVGSLASTTGSAVGSLASTTGSAVGSMVTKSFNALTSLVGYSTSPPVPPPVTAGGGLFSSFSPEVFEPFQNTNSKRMESLIGILFIENLYVKMNAPKLFKFNTVPTFFTKTILYDDDVLQEKLTNISTTKTKTIINAKDVKDNFDISKLVNITSPYPTDSENTPIPDIISGDTNFSEATKPYYLNNLPKVTGITGFSNVFLYKIWLLMIINFIISQKELNLALKKRYNFFYVSNIPNLEASAEPSTKASAEASAKPSYPIKIKIPETPSECNLEGLLSIIADDIDNCNHKLAEIYPIEKEKQTGGRKTRKNNFKYFLSKKRKYKLKFTIKKKHRKSKFLTKKNKKYNKN